MPNYRGKRGFLRDKSKRGCCYWHGGTIKKAWKEETRMKHRAKERMAIATGRWDDLRNHRSWKYAGNPWNWRFHFLDIPHV